MEVVVIGRMGLTGCLGIGRELDDTMDHLVLQLIASVLGQQVSIV